LLKAGVAPHVVQQPLGHKKISTTLEICAHALRSMQQDAAQPSTRFCTAVLSASTVGQRRRGARIVGDPERPSGTAPRPRAPSSTPKLLEGDIPKVGARLSATESVAPLRQGCPNCRLAVPLSATGGGL
jgi:hypothetical protein